jgi:hypothetical protein
MVATSFVWLESCQDPSATWPARQTAARRKRPATPVGMTDAREMDRANSIVAEAEEIDRLAEDCRWWVVGNLGMLAVELGWTVARNHV